MIMSTFCHIKGVGTRLERKLWKAGILDWQTALAEKNLPILESILGRQYVEFFQKSIKDSQEYYERKDLKALVAGLPTEEWWRILEDFLQEALFLDIETGIDESGNQNIVVLGTYKVTEGYKPFIYGRNREDFPIFYEEHSLVVTFNGSRFDLPVIKKTFPAISEPHIHVDLFLTSKRVGLKGSLKKIEKHFGISRDIEIDGMNGYDALKLWNAWFLQKDERALELLIRYNMADTLNLKHLAEALVRLIKEKTLPGKYTG